MSAASGDLLEQLDRHLQSPCLAWLLGAGISYDAGIPLMVPLTRRVMALMATSPHHALLVALEGELKSEYHIEHLLSQLGDYAALADRAKSKAVMIGGSSVPFGTIEVAHNDVLTCIADIVRWGYRPAAGGNPELVGKYGEPIISVRGHKEFIDVLFGMTQAGLQERRQAVRLFTTNYDTLLEDALALAAVPYWDGFSGGGVAFRCHRFGQEEPAKGYRAHLVKLHGSIDWHLGEDGKVWRVRDGDAYPSSRGRVLIHPQSTKYVATQRDPFASQFDLFRRALAANSDNVLAICGYSFGDDHINQEIELALERPDSRTTLVAFCNEGVTMPECLQQWRNSRWGSRVYVVTEKGLYVGKDGPSHEMAAGTTHGWWTFRGVTTMLRDGAESCA